MGVEEGGKKKKERIIKILQKCPLLKCRFFPKCALMKTVGTASALL